MFKKIGSVCAVLFALALIWAIVTPLGTPRIPLNQMHAKETLETVVRTQRNFARRNPSKGFACKLQDLTKEGPGYDPEYLDSVAGSGGPKSGYLFELHCSPEMFGRVIEYTVTAVPSNPGRTGELAFCTDQNGQVWANRRGSVIDCLREKKPFKTGLLGSW